MTDKDTAIRELIAHIDTIDEAIQSDGEHGSHGLNNAKAEEWKRNNPALLEWMLKLNELREKTRIKYYIVHGPDGIPTCRDTLPTIEAAYDEIAAFCKRYIPQGYYSSVDGRIPLHVLPSQLWIEEGEE